MEETLGYEALFSAEEWAEMNFADLSDLDNWGDPEEVPASERPRHEVQIHLQDIRDDGDQAYRLTCSICDDIGGADTVEEAQAIARLHEEFVAVLVGKWSVEQ